ncbi:MAG: vWA domain-containing protein [Verrucomicrobiota bacterium]
MLPELQSLAALASSCPDVVLNVGEADCNWSFNWATRIITVNPVDLALRSPDYCRGLILHESAHAALTRFGDIVPSEIYQANIHPLLNVIEDCRIENWLQQRFPGCRPWIRLYNDRILGRITDSDRKRLAADPAGGFLAGLLDHWWNESSVLTLHPESQAALEQVMPHFEQVIAAFPSPESPDATRIRQHYHSHPVSICYCAQDHDSEPSSAECIIRMLQHRVWAITWQHIVPVFLRLLDHPDSEPTRQAIAQRALGNAQAAAVPADPHQPSSGESQYSHRRGTGRGKPGDSNLTFAAGTTGAYAKELAKHAALIETCAATLLRILTADARPKRSRFHRSGHALDLRVAMQFEADPRQHERLWQRVSLPRRPDPAFVLLIDGSGSMEGPRAEATFAALVVLREVCLRLGIPLTIIAFASDAQLIQAADAPDSPAAQARLASLLAPCGGTDINPALDIATQHLNQCPNRHRHLWILSDGDTRDPDEARTKLRSIRRDGVRVHGLGLGPESTEIADLIPGSPTNLTPNQLPAVLAKLLQSQVAVRR